GEMRLSEVRACCALLVFASTALPQEFRASIGGQILDQSGAAVEGAKVSAASVERNLIYESATNSIGRYNLSFLLPGPYTITVEKAGFKIYVREGVTVLAADRLAIDIKLEIGVAADRVTVLAAAPLLQTETATRQAVVENRVLENVPAGGRNLYALQYDAPGVVK